VRPRSATGAQMVLVHPLSVKEVHRAVTGATPIKTSARAAVEVIGAPKRKRLPGVCPGSATGAQMALVHPRSVKEEHRAVTGATPIKTSARAAVEVIGAPERKRLPLPRHPVPRLPVQENAKMAGCRLGGQPTPRTLLAAKGTQTTMQELIGQSVTSTALAITQVTLLTLVISRMVKS